MAWIEYSEFQAKVYFWRTKAGREVDFVVYGESIFRALEVKNTGTIRKSDLSGLKGFLEEYPEADGMLLYRGEERLMIDGILCIPCEEFLRGVLVIQNPRESDH